MTYLVKTDVFEGPLDLLLQLITSHQVEITELSLTDLVSQYLVFLDAMREADMGVTSEFLLIAATLIQLKARRLLPGEPGVELDEELALAAERDKLLSRLLACLTFKDVAAVLGHRFEVEERFTPRRAGLDPDIRPAPPELRLTFGIDDLAHIAARVATRRRIEPDLDHLDLALPSVEEALADLRHRVRDTVETDFDSVTAHCDRPVEVAAYFVALLELVRWGVLEVSQEGPDAAIGVRLRSGEANQLEQAWG